MGTTNLYCSSKLKCCVLALSFYLGAWSAANSMPISLDLGSSPNITSHLGVTFNDLNGISLQGQTLSLDFLFANGKFARLFSVTDSGFEVALTLNTNGSGVVGFLDGSGSLLDQSGNALGSPEMLGSASGSDGSMAAGLFPLLSNQFSRPLDFFGVHLQLTLPDNFSVNITGGQFELVSAGAGSRDVFGIGPGVPRDIVPDAGSTLLLFGLVLLALPLVRRAGRLA